MNVIPRSVATWESKPETEEIERPSDRETERPRDRAKSLSMLIASSLWSLWSQGLKVSETVDGSANLEILRVAQDDIQTWETP